MPLDLKRPYTFHFIQGERPNRAHRPVGCRLRVIYEGKAPTLVGAANWPHEYKMLNLC